LAITRRRSTADLAGSAAALAGRASAIDHFAILV